MSLVQTIQEDIAQRRIADARGHMDTLCRQMREVSPSAPQYGQFVGLFAQLVHLGYTNVRALQQLLDRFAPETELAMQVVDFAHLTLARGIHAFIVLNYSAGIKAFDEVMRSPAADRNPILVTTATYYQGRCLVRQGEDRDGLDCLRRAHKTASEAALAGMAAVVAVPEAWLTFHHEGNVGAAKALLAEARTVLDKTDDRVTIAHCLITEARIDRRLGKEEESIALLPHACERLRHPTPAVSNLAKALIDLAIAERLAARRLERNDEQGVQQSQDRLIALALLAKPEELVATLGMENDRVAASLRTHDVKNFLSVIEAVVKQGSLKQVDRRKTLTRIEALREASETHLKEAHELFGALKSPVSSGSIALNDGLLALDRLQWEKAAELGKFAFDEGQRTSDHSLMSRASILQCQSALRESAMDASIAESDPIMLSQAVKYARLAVDEAKQTQSKRLQGKAYTWLGIAITAHPDEDRREARHCRDTAHRCIGHSGREYVQDYAQEDLALLTRRLRHTTNAEEIFRRCLDAAAHGQTAEARHNGEKPLRQRLIEQFEEIIVIEAYDACDGRPSAIAEHLGMGFEKVMRVLGRVGLDGKSGRPNKEE